MADIPARTEIGVTTGPIRGSRKIHVGPLRVAMRAIDLEPSSGEPPLNVYDTSGPYTDPAATIDIAHDDADGGKKLACPLLALWGERGVIGKCFDPLALWRERAQDVCGRALPGGHYLAEEVPDLVAAEFRAFFGETA